MSETATVVENAVAGVYNERADMGVACFTVSVPNGWDDVKKLTKKVLHCNGRDFTFRGWNSDDNKCFFQAPLNGPNHSVATVAKGKRKV